MGGINATIAVPNPWWTPFGGKAYRLKREKTLMVYALLIVAAGNPTVRCGVPRVESVTMIVGRYEKPSSFACGH